MSVKTNVEYQAMQKEIEFAQSEVKAIEERILVQMLDGDQIAAAVKTIESELAAEQKAVEADRRAMATDMANQHAVLERLGGERLAIAASLDPAVLRLFETVAARRHGVGLAEAKNGICTVCHVRLRPQVFNTVRRNAGIVQCESCQRILYFAAPAPAETAAADSVEQSAPPQ
jgi:predicted  nucleic acid-binding Zn-ribbon protein